MGHNAYRAARQEYALFIKQANFKITVCHDVPQRGRQIVTGAFNRTVVTRGVKHNGRHAINTTAYGFVLCVTENIVCDSINRPGDLDL